MAAPSNRSAQADPHWTQAAGTIHFVEKAPANAKDVGGFVSGDKQLVIHHQILNLSEADYGLAAPDAPATPAIGSECRRDRRTLRGRECGVSVNRSFDNQFCV